VGIRLTVYASIFVWIHIFCSIALSDDQITSL
jgi:hypothetical protein